MLEKFFAVIDALYEGKSLRNAATWKNRQMAVNAVLAVLGVLVAFKPDLPISGEQMDSIAGGIVTVGGIIATILTPATSDKVGFKSK